MENKNLLSRMTRLAPSAHESRASRLVERLLLADVHTYMRMCQEELEKLWTGDNRSELSMEDVRSVIRDTFTLPPIVRTVNVATKRNNLGAFGKH